MEKNEIIAEFSRSYPQTEIISVTTPSCAHAKMQTWYREKVEKPILSFRGAADTDKVKSFVWCSQSENGKDLLTLQEKNDQYIRVLSPVPVDKMQDGDVKQLTQGRFLMSFMNSAITYRKKL